MPTGDPAAGTSDVTRFTGKPPPGPPPHLREGCPPPKEEASGATRESGKRDSQKQQRAPIPPHGMESMKKRLYTQQVLKIAAITGLTQFGSLIK